MAGLLAWAADVVGRNGNFSDNEEEDGEAEEERKKGELSRWYPPEQRERLKNLNVAIATLQRRLQQLRHRIAPLSPSLSLSHLQNEAAAAEFALASERKAHQDTLLQAQMREASLLEENTSYSKAIVHGRQQMQEKLNEFKKLKAQLQELEAEERNLGNKLNEVQEKGVADVGESNKAEKQKETGSAAEDKPVLELQNLQWRRSDLKRWEEIAKKVEMELEALQQNKARWPSQAQRENELERRLRTLTEQFLVKQAQAESFRNECNALELRLEQASEARQQLHMGNNNANGSLKGNKIRRLRLSSSSMHDDSKIHTPPGFIRNFPFRAELFRFFEQCQTLIQLPTSMAMRALVALYILGLHVIVFFILSPG